MAEEKQYIVDSDVLITAKNLYYAFQICPGFWDSLLHFHSEGRVFSIDRVKSELLAGRKTEDLVLWVKNEVPDSFFLDMDGEDEASAYGDIMLWVQRSAQFFDNAKAQFATGADGWLVAYAKVHDAIVLTNEQFRADVKNRVPIPNVCKQFDVPYVDTFAALKDLSARFVMEGKH